MVWLSEYLSKADSMPLYHYVGVLMAFFVLPGIGNTESDHYVDFDDAHLSFGKTVWLGTCEACHGYGVAGAPIPMKSKQWKSRVVKPRELLYQHALDGFFGPDDTMMPARGGNPELSDDEVKAAVDYMVELATFYIQQERK